MRNSDAQALSSVSKPDSLAPWPSPGLAWYAVAILLLAYIFSFIDRTILALLVTPIKADLGLSDTAIGLLHGFAFAIFYTVMGIPIGRLADREKSKKEKSRRCRGVIQKYPLSRATVEELSRPRSSCRLISVPWP